jgi:hypothetical protein
MSMTTLYHCKEPEDIEYEITFDVEEDQVDFAGATKDGEPCDLDEAVEAFGQTDDQLREAAAEQACEEATQRWEAARDDEADRRYRAKFT